MKSMKKYERESRQIKDKMHDVKRLNEGYRRRKIETKRNIRKIRQND